MKLVNISINFLVKARVARRYLTRQRCNEWQFYYSTLMSSAAFSLYRSPLQKINRRYIYEINSQHFCGRQTMQPSLSEAPALELVEWLVKVTKF